MKPFIQPLLCLCAVALLSVPSAAALEVRGRTLPDIREVNGALLEVRGSHFFKWAFWEVEICVLYADPNVPSDQLMSGDHAMALLVHYLRDFDKEDMVEATVKGVAQTRGLKVKELGDLRAPLDEFNAAYPAVKEGEHLTYVYQPGVGISLESQDETLVTIADKDLAMAIFEIWLGKDPVDDDMRDDLLGID